MLNMILKEEDKSLVSAFNTNNKFDISKLNISEVKKLFNNFKQSIEERTQYQLVAQKTDGTELKSKFYDEENMLADMQRKCEDSEEYEATHVLKRIVGTDENNEDDIEGGIAGDKSELYKLTDLALKQIPGSPNQKKTIEKLNQVRQDLDMKPLK